MSLTYDRNLIIIVLIERINMKSKAVLKDIIVSNDQFIKQQVKDIVVRKGIALPEALKKAVVFYGVRRSGKTFILFDLFKKYLDCALYVDFEDERLTEFDVGDFERLREAFLELKPELIGKELAFFLDEVQNIEGWERFCRRAVERENIRIFVTGSSSKMMPQEIHTELRGRAWGIEVLPFSFREYLDGKGIALQERDAYGPRKAIIKKHFYEYMRWGGFPEVSYLGSDLERMKLLREYIGAMFFRDLVERYNITNITLLDALTDRLFSSFSLKFSPSSFYKQYKDKFPFSKDLLFRYYKYFLQSMLVFEVRMLSESTYKRMRNPAKLYLVDTGLCKRVSSADAGRLLENVVYLELRRRGYEVYYFEAKRECDFVIKGENEGLMPFQVCYELTGENRKREIEGLVEACRRVGKNEGTLLTYDEEEEFDSDGIKIRVLPVWKWLVF